MGVAEEKVNALVCKCTGGISGPHDIQSPELVSPKACLVLVVFN